MHRVLVLLVFFICSFFYWSPAAAQQDQSEEQSLLPEIDPQDIEIRSQFQARFPGLRRQPILGFNPRPRVFQIDPDRMPFIEDEETVVANLPIGELSRPDPPAYEGLGYATPKHAFIRAGIGSYISPELDAFATAKFSDHNWLSTDLHFNSSDGHDERVKTSYRFADVSLKSFNRLSEKTNLVLKAGVISNFNHQLQLNSDVEDLLNTNTKISRLGFNGSANVNVAQTSLSGTSISAKGFYDEFTTESGRSEFEGTASEGGADISAEYSRLGKNLYEVHSLHLQTKLAATTTLSTGVYDWSVTTLSARYERLFNYKTDVHLSFGVSGVNDAVDDFNVYISPRAKINHTVFRGLQVRGEVLARPTHQTYSEIHSENRFFNINSILRHQYEMRALGELEMEPFYGTKILGGASFQDVKNYLYYNREQSPMNIGEISGGYYSAEFEDATIFKVYGGFTQDLKPDVLWFSADGYWQVPTFADDERIPFTETVSLKAALSFQPKDNLLLEGWGEFAGGREDHLGANLSSFALIGGRFELSLSENVGVYGKLLNLLNENYELWQGYEERGFQGFAGFTFLF